MAQKHLARFKERMEKASISAFVKKASKDRVDPATRLVSVAAKEPGLLLAVVRRGFAAFEHEQQASARRIMKRPINPRRVREAVEAARKARPSGTAPSLPLALTPALICKKHGLSPSHSLQANCPMLGSRS